jgi:hypothetical protein
MNKLCGGVHMSEAGDPGKPSNALRTETAEAIEASIVRLERERRAPDHYESFWLVRAIAWFSAGKFMEATLDLGQSQKPVILRTPPDCLAIREHHQTLTTRELRLGWDDRRRR